MKPAWLVTVSMRHKITDLTIRQPYSSNIAIIPSGILYRHGHMQVNR